MHFMGQHGSINVTLGEKWGWKEGLLAFCGIFIITLLIPQVRRSICVLYLMIVIAYERRRRERTIAVSDNVRNGPPR